MITTVSFHKCRHRVPASLKCREDRCSDLVGLPGLGFWAEVVFIAPVRGAVERIAKGKEVVRSDVAQFRDNPRCSGVQFAALRSLAVICERRGRTPDELRARLLLANKLKSRLEPLRPRIRRRSKRMKPVVEVDDVVFRLVEID